LFAWTQFVFRHADGQPTFGNPIAWRDTE